MSRSLEKNTNSFLIANEMELDNFTLEKQPSRGQHEHSFHIVTNSYPSKLSIYLPFYWVSDIEE